MSNGFENIDKIIREKFSDFAPQPPASVWEKIRKLLGGSGGGTILFPVLTITGLLLVIVAMLVNDFPPGIHHTLRAGNIEQQPPVINPRNAPAGPMTITQSLLTEKETHFAAERKTISLKTEALPAHPELLSPQTENIGEDSEKPTRGDLLAGRMEMTRGFVDEAGLKDLALMTKKTAGDYFSKGLAEWSLGLWFHPEATLHNDPSLQNTQSLGLHFSASVRKGNMVFQTGLGLKNSKDRGNYNVTFNQYLGSYQHVYEVTYDSTENGVVPTYHTVTQEVYDTIPHFAIAESKIHYRYLEIPLMAGYQKDFRKISLTVKGGVNASILFDSNIRNTSVNDEKIRVITEEKEQLERADVNWQLLLHAGITYRINSQFSFGIEPSARYFMSSEYKYLPGKKGSCGLGIRTGIIYHINQ